MAEGLGHDVTVVAVEQAPTPIPDAVDLLVIGGPTHTFTMSRPSTRQTAVDNGAEAGHQPRGIREWLEALPTSDHLDVATFDTRITKVRHLPGSVPSSAGRKVRRHHVGRRRPARASTSRT